MITGSSAKLPPAGRTNPFSPSCSNTTIKFPSASVAMSGSMGVVQKKPGGHEKSVVMANEPPAGRTPTSIRPDRSQARKTLLAGSTATRSGARASAPPADTFCGGISQAAPCAPLGNASGTHSRSAANAGLVVLVGYGPLKISLAAKAVPGKSENTPSIPSR